MRNAIEIIHGAIEWIDDPLVVARLVAHDSFFAIKRVLWEFFQERVGDQILRFDIDLELDVMRLGRIDPKRPLKMLAKQIASGAGRAFGSRSR